MRRFNYTGFKGTDKDLTPVSGILWAKDEDSAREKIQKLGIKIRSIQSAAHLKKLDSEEIIQFTRELSLIVKSNSPISDGLKEFKKAKIESNLKNLILDIEREINKGASLSESLGKKKGIFPSFYTNLIKAGEIIGNLNAPLSYLSTFLLKRRVMKRKITNACFYPLLIFFIFFIEIAIILFYFPPHFYSNILPNSENPFINPDILYSHSFPFTVHVNIFIRKHIKDILLSLFIVIFLLVLVGRRIFIKKILDTVKLRIPLFGRLFALEVLYRFSYLVGSMLKLKIPPYLALKLVSDTEFNAAVFPMLDNIVKIIEKGGKITGGIRDTTIFPRSISWILTSAENRGELEDALLEVANYAETEIEDHILRIRFFEPVLLIILGIIMGICYVLFCGIGVNYFALLPLRYF